ncbi:MAG: ABC transporter permease [Candidatus Omnitrophica bacterium]|nr:ABC transporter permease [Candidatus Omnitrophota bacterium]
MAAFSLKELWLYRDLLYFLVWRDIKVRYKQTVIGGAWAVIQPFFAMVVFSLFFGRLARIPSDNIPYPIFAFAALVPWTYFANSLSLATNSLVEHRAVITKIYFPRIILPLSSVLGGLVDFSIAFIVLIGMMFFYGIALSPLIWFVPLLTLLLIITVFSVSLWLSALNVEYRDVRYAVGFLIQLWLFASPVAYPASLVPQKWRFLYGLNPMAGVIEGFRSILLMAKAPDFGMLLVSSLVVLLVFISGIVYFQRVEESFADVV